MINTKNNTIKRKTRVAVLYGGRSSEHEVSLVSATNVVQNLDRKYFDVVPIGIDKQGCWYWGEDRLPLQLPQDEARQLFAPHRINPLLVAAKECVQHNADIFFSNEATAVIDRHPSISIAKSDMREVESLFDVIFPVIHGPLCEDGTVQGLLELADVPYVGCGVLASAIGMDKDVAKRLVMQAGLSVSPYLAIKQGEWKKNQITLCAMIQQQLTYPLFVKPVNAGSSVGVQKVQEPADLIPAIENAFQFDTKILVEQGIDGMELEVSVLESLSDEESPIVSVAGAIKPQNGHEFYSYAAKYLDPDGAAFDIPAPLNAEQQAAVSMTAKTIFAVLECEGMTRVDLFLEKATNRVYFNEINTIPGFTSISMYPKLMAASGVSYSDLLTHLVELAIKRHDRKKQLRREYEAVS